MSDLMDAILVGGAVVGGVLLFGKKKEGSGGSSFGAVSPGGDLGVEDGVSNLALAQGLYNDVLLPDMGDSAQTGDYSLNREDTPKETRWDPAYIFDKGELVASGGDVGLDYAGFKSIAIVPTEILLNERGDPEGLGASALYSQSGGAVVNIGGSPVPVGTSVLRATGNNEITVSKVTQHQGSSGAGTTVIETSSYRADRVTAGGYYWGGSEGEYIY